MRLELVERRVLGAVRFTDVTTGRQISGPLTVHADNVDFRVARSGYFVVFSAPGLEAHTLASQTPPAAPPLGSVALSVTVMDPQWRYLPRRFTLRLPRDPDPSHGDQPNWLFGTESVSLYPSPAARMASGWAVLRVSVTHEPTGFPLPGALVRAVRSNDATLLAAGISDARGEAVVAIPGVPITTSEEGDGPVLTTEVEATVAGYFNAAAGPVPDPDQLEADHETLPTAAATVRLASGRTITISLAIPVPID